LAQLLRLVSVRKKINDEQKRKAQKRYRKKNADPVASKKYQNGAGFGRAGKLSEALDSHPPKYLDESPNNAENSECHRAIHYCLHRTDEAIEHFIKAKELQPNLRHLWNLAEAYLSGKAKQAVELFDAMEKLGILNADC
jgi:predicted Zn-dependent protease